MVMTASYSGSTLKITKGDKGANNLNYDPNAAAVDSVASAGSYGSSTTMVDASALGAAVQLNATVGGNIYNVIGGKGADTITVIDSTITDYEGLNVTLGAGNDVLALEGSRYVNVSDFSNTDAIQLGSDFKTDMPNVDFGARGITLKFDHTTQGKDSQYVYLNGGEDKIITIKQGTDTLYEQAFQRAAQPVYDANDYDYSNTIYTATNTNTGKKLSVDTAYIDASARSTALEINAGIHANEIIGGKGNDVIKVAKNSDVRVTTGKGNDTVQVNAGSSIYIDDFTLGGKDVIQLGEGLDTVVATPIRNDEGGDDDSIKLTISNSTNNAINSATVTIAKGLWDQISKESTKTIKFVDSAGAELKDFTKAYGDPEELVYSAKIDKKNNTFDFANSIAAGDSNKKLGDVVVSTDVTKLTFNTSSALNIVGGKAGTNGKIQAITTGKGKDTLIGSTDTTNRIALYGGAGNDYLFSNNGVSAISGDAGNDTLRGSGPNADIYGGAGNDVFLLSGNGSGTIYDYTNTTDKALKKALGTDKIVTANDKWAAKNTTLNARTSITGGSLSNDYLTISIEGIQWAASVAADAQNGIPESIPAQFDNSKTISGTYTIYSHDSEGNSSAPTNLTIVDQGVTYNMVLPNATDTVVAVSGSYLGLITPNVKEITTADNNKKALRLVGSANTTAITGGTKNDTLVGGGRSVLTGGNGNDIFIAKVSDVIADYSASGTKGKDKIMIDELSEISSAQVSGTSDLKLGNITINGVADGKAAVTFQEITETPTFNAKKGVYTGSKKVTNTMTRTFSTSATDSILAVGSSTFMLTFNGIDDNIKTINGAKKAVNIINGASHVTSIQGSGKVDTISIGSNSDNISAAGTANSDTGVITLSAGKGNDVIYWDGSSDAVIADYNAGKLAKKVNTGDVIIANITGDGIQNKIFASDTSGAVTTTVNSAYIDFDGKDAIITSKVGGGAHTLRIVGAKDAAARILNRQSMEGFDASATVAAADMVTLTSIHEVHGVSNGIYDGNNDDYKEAYIVDGSGYKKGNSIVSGKYFTQITGGAGVDTIIAGTKSSTMRGGSGADYFAFDSLADADLNAQTYVIADYEAGKDKLVFRDDVSIDHAVITNKASVTTTKKGKSTTTNYSDVTLFLSNNREIKITDLNATNLALLQADSVGAKAKTFSMVYGASDVTVSTANVAKGGTIDLSGVGEYQQNGSLKLNVVVDDKRKNAVTFKNAAAGATVSAGSGAAVTFYGNESAAATYNGNAKADVYYGAGAADKVDLGAGANTIFGGGRADATVGSAASNVIVVKDGDAFDLHGFTVSGKIIDKIVLDNAWTKAGISSATDGIKFNNDGKDLVINFTSDTTAAYRRNHHLEGLYRRHSEHQPNQRKK